MSPHPHAAIIKAFADDPTVKIDWFDRDVLGWKPSSIEAILSRPHYNYRLAPKEPQVDPEKYGFIQWKGQGLPEDAPDRAYGIGKCGKVCDLHSLGNRACQYPECMPKKPQPDADGDIVRYRIHKPEKAKRYKYLWAHKAGTVVFREEEFDGASVGAIRLEWSKTEVPE